MRNLRRIGGLGRGSPARGSSFFPLIAISLFAAVLLTQNSVTLAYPLFQSPVQSPAPTTTPPEVEPGPPAESPVVPPSETPIVPPGETPGASPAVEPGETPGAPAEPRLTPSVAAPGEVSTAEPPTGEEGAAPVSEDSLAVLIDALVVGLSSLWLCCGGLALLIFFLLVVASFLLRVT